MITQEELKVPIKSKTKMSDGELVGGSMLNELGIERKGRETRIPLEDSEGSPVLGSIG